mmetsp:Transcript_98065/g.245690  ORF Transcript_98065/g.245690 Transcript_98065/m.245690 type:complete len:247 (-) Transcript_98065:496-1236(-)
MLMLVQMTTWLEPCLRQMRRRAPRACLHRLHSLSRYHASTHTGAIVDTCSRRSSSAGLHSWRLAASLHRGLDPRSTSAGARSCPTHRTNQMSFITGLASSTGTCACRGERIYGGRSMVASSTCRTIVLCSASQTARCTRNGSIGETSHGWSTSTCRSRMRSEIWFRRSSPSTASARTRPAPSGRSSAWAGSPGASPRCGTASTGRAALAQSTLTTESSRCSTAAHPAWRASSVATGNLCSPQTAAS